MGRTKRVIDLVVRVVFIVLCLVLTYLFNAVGNFTTGSDINMLTEESAELLVDGNAEAKMSFEDGKAVVEVITPGDKYTDITVLINVDKISPDTSVLKDAVGEMDGETKEYFEKLDNGPWVTKMHYQLTGDELFANDKSMYTFSDGIHDDYPMGVASSGANQDNVSDELVYEKGDGALAVFTLGSEDTGSLPAGKYYLTSSLYFTGVENEDGTVEKMPRSASASAFGTLALNALKNTSFTSFFEISSLLTFYGMIVAFGCVFYLYSDLRSAIKIGAIAAAGDGKVYTVVISTYINGVYSGSRTETYTNGSPFIGCVAFVLSYMLFIITIPLRMVVIIIKDIIHIAAGDANEEGFPLFGNLFGSIGVYAALVCFITLYTSAPVVWSIIAGVIAIPCLIIAGKLCRNAEEYWD